MDVEKKRDLFCETFLKDKEIYVKNTKEGANFINWIIDVFVDDKLLKNIDGFFVEKWWKRKNNIFFKWDLKIWVDHRKLIKPKKKIFLEDILKVANEVFSKSKSIPPFHINYKKIDTFFVVAWIQSISNVLFEERQYDNNWYYISQPVIRIKYLDNISWDKGNGISFVNFTVLKVWVTLSEFLKKVDESIWFLSKLWLYAWNVSLRIRKDSPVWNNRKMKNIIIDIYYWNLQIGDAVFIYDFEQKTRTSLTVADIWFGLERIIYARNRIHNYFEQFWLNFKRYSETEVEVVKTLSLIFFWKEWMLTQNQKNQIKKLYKKLDKSKNYFPLIDYSIEYWNSFYNNSKLKAIYDFFINLENLSN